MRGNNAAMGYFQQSEATVEAFRGGWFTRATSRCGIPTATWSFGPEEDIIISGGENISTIEVEQAVARHPRWLECAVVAVPGREMGRAPKAFVTLRPGPRGDRAGDHRLLPAAHRPFQVSRGRGVR